MVNKDKLMEELQTILYTEVTKFVKKHNLSIKSIKMDSKHTTIIENGTIMDSPSMTKVYKLSNTKLNGELNNG